MDEDSKRRETVKMNEYREHIEMDAETVAIFGNFEDEQCTAPLDAFASAVDETLGTGAAVSASENVDVEYAGKQNSHQTIVVYYAAGTRVTTLDEIETAIMAAREL